MRLSRCFPLLALLAQGCATPAPGAGSTPQQLTERLPERIGPLIRKETDLAGNAVTVAYRDERGTISMIVALSKSGARTLPEGADSPEVQRLLAGSAVTMAGLGIQQPGVNTERAPGIVVSRPGQPAPDMRCNDFRFTRATAGAVIRTMICASGIEGSLVSTHIRTAHPAESMQTAGEVLLRLQDDAMDRLRGLTFPAILQRAPDPETAPASPGTSPPRRT